MKKIDWVINCIRRFLHLFGIHDWSDWSNPIRVDASLTKTLTGDRVIMQQERYCFVCNLTQYSISDIA